MVGRKQGESKNSIGNVEAKELICVTHGYELKGGMCVGGEVQGRGGEKKWDNCNNTINKIYFLKNNNKKIQYHCWLEYEVNLYTLLARD